MTALLIVLGLLGSILLVGAIVVAVHDADVNASEERASQLRASTSTASATQTGDTASAERASSRFGSRFPTLALLVVAIIAMTGGVVVLVDRLESRDEASECSRAVQSIARTLTSSPIAIGPVDHVPHPFGCRAANEGRLPRQERTGDLLKSKARVQRLRVGETVFRVYGGDAKKDGLSWTPTNPYLIERVFGGFAYRHFAGLPDSNSGRQLVKCRVTRAVRVRMVSATPLGHSRWLPGTTNSGGLPEYLVPGGTRNLAIKDACQTSATRPGL